MERKSGILMPIFSLPSKYGIGDFGKESYKFVDFLVKSKQSVWQILPLTQTGYGNSPYSSVYSESFNPFFISVERLKEDKLLTASELKSAIYTGEFIDYGKVYENRFSLLRIAFNRFNKKDSGFNKFLKEKRFFDYAIFMSAKTIFSHKPFYEWEDGLKFREVLAIKNFAKQYTDEVTFWQFVQFRAEKEWYELKNYANEKGIKILGDIPLYTALDSVDVWVNPTLFKLNSDFTPKKVAGVPPDYFSKSGQLWGNPVFDYENHEKSGFSWWRKRIKSSLKKYDLIRIDHFRGLDRFYEVDFGLKDATVGEWVKAPGEEIFGNLSKKDLKSIIAEDLGIIDDGVRELLKKIGLPGMKILSFAFNGEKDNLYLPENVNENSVIYTGTHDNDTLKGLIDNFSEWDYNNLISGVKESLGKLKLKKEILNNDDLIDAIIFLGFKSKSNLFILPLADVLHYGANFRINEPGTVKNQNWAVRFDAKDFSAFVIKKLRVLTEESNRC